MAKGKELRFLSVYMLYRTFNIFDKPMSLDLNYHKYQREFPPVADGIQASNEFL